MRLHLRGPGYLLDHVEVLVRIWSAMARYALRLGTFRSTTLAASSHLRSAIFSLYNGSLSNTAASSGVNGPPFRDERWVSPGESARAEAGSKGVEVGGGTHLKDERCFGCIGEAFEILFRVARQPPIKSNAPKDVSATARPEVCEETHRFATTCAPTSSVTSFGQPCSLNLNHAKPQVPPACHQLPSHVGAASAAVLTSPPQASHVQPSRRFSRGREVALFPPQGGTARRRGRVPPAPWSEGRRRGSRSERLGGSVPTLGIK